jgi:hypothetical protein
VDFQAPVSVISAAVSNHLTTSTVCTYVGLMLTLPPDALGKRFCGGLTGYLLASTDDVGNDAERAEVWPDMDEPLRTCLLIYTRQLGLLTSGWLCWHRRKTAVNMPS